MKMQELYSKDRWTKTALSKGLHTWEECLSFVQKIPYARTSNRTDLTLVITENKGTCSSKHAFLKKIADHNGVDNVKLLVGIYKMNNENTPGIGSGLQEAGMDYLPEAHCYLRIGEKVVDVTMPHSNFKGIQMDVIEEYEINPDQIGQHKIDLHKSYLQKWIKKQGLDIGVLEIWSIREKCIAHLITSDKKV